MNKTMLVAVISVAFLGGTVISTTIGMISVHATGCADTIVPKGHPFSELWDAICALQIETSGLAQQISEIEQPPNPINCPPPGSNLAGSTTKLTPLTLENLLGCDLSGANLSNVDLRFANLFGADLSSANLLASQLQGANLQNADLRLADLSGTNFAGADLTGADLTGATINSGTKFTDLTYGPCIGNSHCV